MKTLLLSLILSSMRLSGEQDRVVWRLSGGDEIVEVLSNHSQVRWGEKGKNELYFHIRRGGVDTLWHPYMCSVAGLILEGLAMDARDREVSISIVQTVNKDDNRIRFTTRGDVEIVFSNRPPIHLSRKDAIAMAVAVHREYLGRIGDVQQSKNNRDQSEPMNKTERGAAPNGP